MKLENLQGMKFGMLTVISRCEPISQRTSWECSCECGNVSKVQSSKLKNGHTKSCGCYRHTFKLIHTPESRRTRNIWNHMIDRCNNVSNSRYSDYGGRGITVCKEWLDFESFRRDMGDAPAGLTLDRKDNFAGYDKANCRWATGQEQQRNRRLNLIITLNGVSKCLSEWAESIGIKRVTLDARIKRGWSHERALTTQ